VYLQVLLTNGVFPAIVLTIFSHSLRVGKPTRCPHQSMHSKVSHPYLAAVGVDCIDTNQATHLIGFSPDGPSGTVAHGSGLGLTATVGSATGCSPELKYEDKDPFTSPGSKVRPEQKLNATASTFQPFSVRLNQGSMHSFIGNRDIQSGTVNTSKLNKGDSQSVDPGFPSDTFNSNIKQQGTFSTDTKVTRAIRISGIYGTVSREQVETLLQASLLLSLEVSFLPSFLGFNNCTNDLEPSFYCLKFICNAN
jgi:hypothetical protein